MRVEFYQWVVAQMGGGTITTRMRLFGDVIEYYQLIFMFQDVPPRLKHLFSDLYNCKGRSDLSYQIR